MRCLGGRIVLALTLTLPLGCLRGQDGAAQLMVPHYSAQAPPIAGSAELSAEAAAQLCLKAGAALEDRGFHAQAIRQYENARRYNPQLPNVAHRLAVLHDLNGDSSRAEAEYQRALKEQGDAELLNDLGYFNYRHNRFSEAETWLGQAVAVDPNCARAWINLGKVLARRGRLDKSYRAFAQVLPPAQAYSNLGVVLAKQGRGREARNALQQAAALDPSLKLPRTFLRVLPSTPALLPVGVGAKAVHKSCVPPSPRAANLPLAPPRQKLLPVPLRTPPRTASQPPAPLLQALPPASAAKPGHSPKPSAAPSELPVIINGFKSMMAPQLPPVPSRGAVATPLVSRGDDAPVIVPVSATVVQPAPMPSPQARLIDCEGEAR